MAIRVSKSGGWISAVRPHSKRVFRRSSRVAMSFGGRDHSTVVYAIRQVEKNLKNDPHMKAMVDDIIKNIRDR